MEGMRVLLVDDHSLVRAGIRALLGSIAGVAGIEEASSGRQAVAVGARPHAGAAGEDDLPRRLDLEAGAFETGKRPRQCAGDMGPGVFVRLADINENGAADLQARSDFSRT